MNEVSANEASAIRRSVVHASFTIERRYDASPNRVFTAFADPKSKALWFHGPEDWMPQESVIDFRIGGRETSRGGPKGGPVHLFSALYHDIVPDQRIIYSYDMHLGERHISVSIATIELIAEAGGTRLRFTEQGAFLDGYDDPAGREHGTRALLEQLDASLAGSR